MVKKFTRFIIKANFDYFEDWIKYNNSDTIF